jgi:hypothetical protein
VAIFIDMSKSHIRENGFEGAGGGTSGTLNYQTGYGTFASPAVSQNSNNFVTANNNKAVNQNSNTCKDAPNKRDMGQDINAIYAKKDTPTPDEVVSGIKYEMGQQIKKDKRTAKEEVLKNLKKDPHFYSGLKMLNIDDKSMVDNMTESKKHPNDGAAKTKITPNVDETKKIFSEMAAANGKKYVVNSQICDVMKEMWAAKNARKL